MDEYLKEMYNKIKQGLNLTEYELLELADCGNIVYRGENRRWSRIMHTLLKLDNELYIIEWENGLTESQPNSCFTQPYKVKAVKEMIEITKYVKV